MVWGYNDAARPASRAGGFHAFSKWEKGSIEAVGWRAHGDILVPISGQIKRGQLAIRRRVRIIV